MRGVVEGRAGQRRAEGGLHRRYPHRALLRQLTHLVGPRGAAHHHDLVQEAIEAVVQSARADQEAIDGVGFGRLVVAHCAACHAIYIKGDVVVLVHDRGHVRPRPGLHVDGVQRVGVNAEGLEPQVIVVQPEGEAVVGAVRAVGSDDALAAPDAPRLDPGCHREVVLQAVDAGRLFGGKEDIVVAAEAYRAARPPIPAGRGTVGTAMARAVALSARAVVEGGGAVLLLEAQGQQGVLGQRQLAHQAFQGLVGGHGDLLAHVEIGGGRGRVQVQLHRDRHRRGVAHPVGGADGDRVASRGPRAAEDVIHLPRPAPVGGKLALGAQGLPLRADQRHEDGLSAHAAPGSAAVERRIDQRAAQVRDPVALQRGMSRRGDQIAAGQLGPNPGWGAVDVERIALLQRFAVTGTVRGPGGEVIRPLARRVEVGAPGGRPHRHVGRVGAARRSGVLAYPRAVVHAQLYHRDARCLVVSLHVESHALWRDVGPVGVVGAQRGDWRFVVHGDPVAAAYLDQLTLVVEDVAHLGGGQSAVVERDLVQPPGEGLAAYLERLVVDGRAASGGGLALQVAVDVDAQRRPVVGAHHVVPLVHHQRGCAAHVLLAAILMPEGDRGAQGVRRDVQACKGAVLHQDLPAALHRGGQDPGADGEGLLLQVRRVVEAQGCGTGARPQVEARRQPHLSAHPGLGAACLFTGRLQAARGVAERRGAPPRAPVRLVQVELEDRHAVVERLHVVGSQRSVEDPHVVHRPVEASAQGKGRKLLAGVDRERVIVDRDAVLVQRQAGPGVEDRRQVLPPAHLHRCRGRGSAITVVYLPRVSYAHDGPAVTPAADHVVDAGADAGGPCPGRQRGAVGAGRLVQLQVGLYHVVLPVEQRGLVLPAVDPRRGTGGAGAVGAALLHVHVHGVLESLAAGRVVEGQAHRHGSGEVELLHLAGGERALVHRQLVHPPMEGNGRVGEGWIAGGPQIDLDARGVLADHAVAVIPLPVQRPVGVAGVVGAEGFALALAASRSDIAERVVACGFDAVVVLPGPQDAALVENVCEMHVPFLIRV